LVILDNSTRWSSTFLSIERGLRLKTPISYYLFDSPALSDDSLTADDWEQLSTIHIGLKPFWEMTLRVEGHGQNGVKGVIWEALPVLNHLLTHCESQVTALTDRIRSPHHTNCDKYLLLCHQNAWDKLNKYNTLSDDYHDLYAAGALLNPCLKKAWYEETWVGESDDWIPIMIQPNRRDHWERKYKETAPIQPPIEFRSALDLSLLSTMRSHQVISDEFTTYLATPPESLQKWDRDNNLFAWWMRYPYSSLRQWAFDILTIPATSAGIERVFSQARRLITDDRNRLSVKNVEVLLCYQHWMRQGLITCLQQSPSDFPDEE
jgi:hypothetical protein